MTIDDLGLAAIAAVLAAAPVALFLLCVRPALRWLRARSPAHVVVAACAVIPAVVTISASDSLAALALAWLATMAVAIAWIEPHLVVRITGGAAEARGELDRVLGYLLPAGQFLDVGDLASAEAHVEEARRISTPVTRAYVQLWDDLVTEEYRRRRGEHISRSERIKAISAEYGRLVQAGDSLKMPHILVVVAIVGAAAAAPAMLLGR